MPSKAFHSLPFHLLENRLGIAACQGVELVQICEGRLIDIDRTDDIAAHVNILTHPVPQVLQIVAGIGLRMRQRGRRTMPRDQVNRLQHLDGAKSLQPGGAVGEIHDAQYAPDIDNVSREHGL